MTIGLRLKRQRERRRFTQTELAERSGVKQSLISRIEGGSRENPTADVLKGLAKALGCTTDYLIGMHEDEESEQLAVAVA
jgi:transcriptional regulator with XRE-family HTH domain